jgi:sulfotransferase family protein
LNKKIIYIIGTARSGTTLTDIILGNNPQLFSAGELNRFPIRYGVCPNIGKDTPAYKYWETFKNDFLNLHQDYRLEELNKLTGKFEYHTGILKIISGNKSTKSREQYYNYLRNFFETLSTKVDKEIIVDSSKYPCRAYHLSQLFKSEISFIYIKRNPVDVTRSFSKQDLEQPPKSWFMSNLYLFCVNHLCIYVLKKVQNNSKVVRIKYDSLIIDPIQTLTSIQEALNINLTRSIEIIKNDDYLITGLLFDGNRLRMKEKIKLEKKIISSPKKLSFKDKITLLFNRSWWK